MTEVEPSGAPNGWKGVNQGEDRDPPEPGEVCLRPAQQDSEAAELKERSPREEEDPRGRRRTPGGGEPGKGRKRRKNPSVKHHRRMIDYRFYIIHSF